MTGWNMPPGCNVSDIPGNRPEDQEEEAFYEWLFDQLSTKMPDEAINEFGKTLWIKMGEAYYEGYKAGQNDEQMAQVYKKQEELPDHGDWAIPKE